MSRTTLAIKNIFFGIGSKIINLILGFASRTVFIYFLGNEYLGINGLYSEILSVLSFAELGFGVALTYSMYAPVANGDEEKTIKLLCFYKKIYRIIAGIVAGVGLAILPFLQYIVKGVDGLTLFDLRLYYLIFLINSVASYFVTYKYSFANAKQLNYITTKYDMISHLVIIMSQIVVIVTTKNFLAYLLTHTGLLIISKFIIANFLNKKFPVLKEKATENLEKEERKKIYKEVKNLAFHQFGSVAVHSTDNIIISSFTGMGVVAVGLISNYNLIMTSVLAFVSIIFNNLTSGFGNLVASSSTENYRKAFLEANFINFWLYGFCSIAFFVLIPPFIILWIGKENLVDTGSFLLIIINSYFQGQSTFYHNARIAKGNFNKDKWVVLLQAVVNLVVSVIMAKHVGLIGVYIGTVVSRLISVIFKPATTYRFLFKKSPFEYYKKTLVYFMVVFCTGYIIYIATSPLLKNITFLKFLLAALITVIIPNVAFCLVFYRSKEFKNLNVRLKGLIRSKRKMPL